MKRILLYVLFFFLAYGNAEATSIDSINTNVMINSDGDGYVTEVWTIDANNGTESYHPFGLMENRSIENFSVSMDGHDYTNIGSWNVDASKTEKMYKNGINTTSDGIELCWGIEYGKHTYTVKYVIKNLVWQYDDSQILYFQFLPSDMNQPPADFNLTVEGNFPADTKYSSYGFNSDNSIQMGKLTFNSKGSISSNEYAVVLIGFPNGTFTPAVTQSGTYDDIANKALAGAKLNNTSVFKDIFNNVFSLLLFGGIVLLIIFFSNKNKSRYIKDDFIIPKTIPNFRDIPFDKDVLEAYFIGKNEKLMSEKNLIGTILLKWIKNKEITLVPTEGELIDFNKDDNYYLDLSNLNSSSNTIESQLMAFLKAAADTNKHLTSKQFSSWCRTNYTRMESFLETAEEYSRSLLIQKGYIEEIKVPYGQNNFRVDYKYTTKLRDEFIKLKGLKQFLEDMTIIDEKKAIEVHIWDEYLIFAFAFGIADKVAKQFKDFYPNEYNQNIYFYNSYYGLHNFSSSATAATASAHAAASSGGSFSGGGGGAGGSSSGGGVR